MCFIFEMLTPGLCAGGFEVMYFIFEMRLPGCVRERMIVMILV
jgi:hypothetical protein